MTERRHWGKAGVRLTPDEVKRRRAAAVMDSSRVAAARAEDERMARRKWEAGLLVPYMITVALDAADLYGPEVDTACGAEEPDVDMWEAGRLYPTWEQLLKLAELTGKSLRVFFERPKLTWLDTSMRFHLTPAQLAAREPVLEFRPAAVAARLRRPVDALGPVVDWEPSDEPDPDQPRLF